MQQQPLALNQIVYNKIGTNVRDMKVGKFYKMIETDGVNTVDLGECTAIDFEPGHHSNDMTQTMQIRFKQNSNHPLLRNNFYGYSIFSKMVNVLEYDPLQ